jgi:hypothetical protein
MISQPVCCNQSNQAGYLLETILKASFVHVAMKPPVKRKLFLWVILEVTVIWREFNVHGPTPLLSSGTYDSKLESRAKSAHFSFTDAIDDLANSLAELLLAIPTPTLCEVSETPKD